MHYIFLIFLLMLPIHSFAAEKADRVVVNKSSHTLCLYQGQRLLASYPVVFGANPKGHKQREGDERTPEGHYSLDYKKANSAYHKAIHISYPNRQDMEDAKRRGEPPGGAIMIHGQRNGFEWASTLTQAFNWTKGCIALSNKDMDAVWSAVEVGTSIEINP